MRTPSPSGAQLRQLMQQKGETPQGFSITDGEDAGLKNGHKLAHKLCGDGQLFKAKVNHWQIRYFTSAVAAVAYLALHKSDVRIAKGVGRVASAVIKPSKEVKIIYPEGYKFTRHPTPPDRFTAAAALPWQHGGMREMKHLQGTI